MARAVPMPLVTGISADRNSAEFGLGAIGGSTGAYMRAASELAGRDIRRDPTTWPIYRRLIRAIVDAILQLPLIVLGVCTPDELGGWPIDSWIVLDCADEERERRLANNGDATDVEDALADAARYRALGLQVIDTTDRTPQSVADALARTIQEPSP